MKKNIYKHSFARRLTRWLMLVLFVMMAGLAYLIYEVVKMSMVEIVALNFHDNMEMSEKSICNAMSDVSVAVENNIFYIERNIGQPAEMQAQDLSVADTSAPWFHSMDKRSGQRGSLLRRAKRKKIVLIS